MRKRCTAFHTLNMFRVMILKKLILVWQWDGPLQSIQRRSGTASENYSTRTSATSSLFNLTHQGWHDQICTDFPHDTATIRNCPIIFTVCLTLLQWAWKCLERSKQHLWDNFLAKEDKHFIRSDSPSTWHDVLLQSPHPMAPCSPGLTSRIAVNKKRIWSLWALSNCIIDNHVDWVRSNVS